MRQRRRKWNENQHKGEEEGVMRLKYQKRLLLLLMMKKGLVMKVMIHSCINQLSFHL